MQLLSEKRDFYGDPPGASHHPRHFYKITRATPTAPLPGVRTQRSKDPIHTQHHQEEEEDCPERLVNFLVPDWVEHDALGAEVTAWEVVKLS